MTEKRYKLSEPNGAYLIDNDRPYAHWINDDDKIIDLLNEQHETIQKLNQQLRIFSDGLKAEIRETKEVFEDYSECVDEKKQLKEENEKLKQSSTMYYNLFKELQRQMQGVKSIYDLDSKDFEDLIELSKGNVFDDEIGWIHLPVKELIE